MDRLIATMLAAVLLPAAAQAQTYEPKNLAQIKDAYANNRPRFDRDYKGKPFAGRLQFKGVHGRLFSFKEGVICRLDESPASTALIDKSIDYNSGHLVQVKGVIDFVNVLRALVLDDCKF